MIGTRLICVVQALVLANAVLTAPSTAQQFLPDGITEDTVITGLDKPVAIAFLPGGRMIVIEHEGRVLVWHQGSFGEVGQVPDVSWVAEDGLIGVAVDPQWPIKPYLYLYHSRMDMAGARTNRLVRFTVTGDVAADDGTDIQLGYQYDVLHGVAAEGLLHNGGDLRFGPDGMLYLPTGDDGSACESQNLDSLLGKVLRLDVSGLPATGTSPPPLSMITPSDNPFTTGSDVRKLVFCYGLRNPWRISIDAAHGVLIGDVGAGSWEEVNVAMGGENFGWPWREGNDPGPLTGCLGPEPPSTAPVIVATHSGILGFSSINLMGIYRNQPGGVNNFGPNYEGQLFYADIKAVAPIFRAEFDGTAWVNPTPEPGQLTPFVWGTTTFPVDAAIGPDGAIYTVNYAIGSVARLRPNHSGRNINVVSGSFQKGNGGVHAYQPLVVELTDEAGMPVAGETVHFGVRDGGGEVTQAVVTDGAGRAQTGYLFGASWVGAQPKIDVIHASSPPTAFDLIWRGLSVDISGPIVFEVRHSAPFSGITLCAQVPPATTPYLNLIYGAVWTSVVTPDPGLVLIGDGLGVAGAPVPGWMTDATSNFVIGFSNVPMTGGLNIDFQAYAIDQFAIGPETFMISNRVRVVLP